MNGIITMDILSATSENGFSLDELVYKTRDLFETKGMAGFVGLILEIVDEHLSTGIARKTIAPNFNTCCLNPHYELHSRTNRRFRTSAGEVSIKWRRLRCCHCGKTAIPLRSFLGLEAYQSKTAELEKLISEIVSEQSYRRSSSHLKSIGAIPVPKSTAHRWVAESDCDKMDTSEKTFDVLFADGTGYKRRMDKEAGLTNRGEIRIALGVDHTGTIVPLGAFSGVSWQKISTIIKGQRDDDQPVAQTLVSDGEEGLVNHLSQLCSEQQRCHWHLCRDLNYTMWQDHAEKSERKEAQGALNAVIGLEIPKEDIEKVSLADRDDLQRAVGGAERDIRKLIGTLQDKGYVRAADYLIRASTSMFTYVRRWLKTGIVTPRVSSMIERMMREIARRLKRMAFGWSEEGAAKMARIIIKRFTSAGQWEKYWKKKLRIKDNVELVLRGIKLQPPQTLGR